MKLYSFDALKDKRLGKIGTHERDTFEKEVAEAVRAKITKARKEHEKGDTLCFNNAQEAIAWMEAL